jgi:hypothetical protein
MKQRLSRFDERIAKKRELALEAMHEVGLTKLEEPDFTVSARMGPPALAVLSEEEIPHSYWLAQSPKLDRNGLLRDLKRGREIPGARLNNPQPVLSVRTK